MQPGPKKSHTNLPAQIAQPTAYKIDSIRITVSKLTIQETNYENNWPQRPIPTNKAVSKTRKQWSISSWMYRHTHITLGYSVTPACRREEEVQAVVRLQQAIRGLRYSKTTSNDWQKPFAGTTSRYTENRFHEAKSMGCRQMRKFRLGRFEMMECYIGSGLCLWWDVTIDPDGGSAEFCVP